jgi:nitrite reductase/ring-hydroxylating ferredoxin subunit
MPELNLSPQLLCESAALREREGSVLFEVEEFGRRVSAFAVRFEGRAVAFVNRCAHVPTELDWQPGEFWDWDKRYIMCAVHGAHYEPHTGHCVLGPCTGKRLQPIALKEEGGGVYWYPSENIQPVITP